MGNTSFDDWEALTSSFGCTGATEARGRERPEHLVDVHVRRGAAAGLVDVDRELVEVLARDDLVGRADDRLDDVGRQHAELAVHDRRAALDAGQRDDLRVLEAASRRSGSSRPRAASAPPRARRGGPAPRPSCRARCGRGRPRTSSGSFAGSVQRVGGSAGVAARRSAARRAPPRGGSWRRRRPRYRPPPRRRAARTRRAARRRSPRDASRRRSSAAVSGGGGSTAGPMPAMWAAISGGRSGASGPAASIAACTAPHRSCASTTTSGTPSTATAYSIDAIAEALATWPALRITKRSPRPWSNSTSAATRESLQPEERGDGRLPLRELRTAVRVLPRVLGPVVDEAVVAVREPSPGLGRGSRRGHGSDPAPVRPRAAASVATAAARPRSWAAEAVP